MLLMRTIALFFVLSINIVHAETVTLSTIKDMPKHVNLSALTEKDWFIFDLDNTVIWPETDGVTSSHGFGKWAELHAQQTGLSTYDAFQELLPHYFERCKTENVKLVEQEFAGLIEALQQQHVTVFVITSRSPQFAPCTERHLNGVNLAFDKTHPEHSGNFERLTHPIIYTNGRFHISNNCKADTLEHILTDLHNAGKPLPRHVIMIDDVERYITKIGTMLAKNFPSITYTGLHYTHLDPYIKNFKLKPHMIPTLGNS